MNKKNILTKVVIVAALVLSNIISYYLGSHWFYMAADVHQDGTESIMYPHFIDLRESWVAERQLANALFEGLHRFYSNDDNESWYDEFVPTKEYQKIDSLMNGDWEDFYYYETPPLQPWFTIYGTKFEPSEAYKDSVDFGIAKALPCPQGILYNMEKYLDHYPQCMGCPVKKYCGTMIASTRLCNSYQDEKQDRKSNGQLLKMVLQHQSRGCSKQNIHMVSYCICNRCPTTSHRSTIIILIVTQKTSYYD